MLVFWEHGCDGASLTALTEAMGISTTSMYAAFGNKGQRQPAVGGHGVESGGTTARSV